MTYFNEIYCLSDTLKNNTALRDVPEYIYYNMSWNFLQAGLGLCLAETVAGNSRVSKYLSDFVNPTYDKYEFISDGQGNIIDIEKQYDEDISIYVGVKSNGCDEFYELAFEEFSYNNNTQQLTVNYPIDEGDYVKVVFYKDGFFNNDLDFSLKMICVEALNLAFKLQYNNDSNTLKQTLYGSKLKMYSQANHQKAVSDSVKADREHLKDMIISYTYHHSYDELDKLKGKK